MSEETTPGPDDPTPERAMNDDTHDAPAAGPNDPQDPTGGASAAAGDATGRASTGPDADRIREQGWACTGPAELEIAAGAGRVRIELSDSAEEVRVQVRADPTPGGPTAGGLGGLLQWIGNSMSASAGARSAGSGSWPLGEGPGLSGPGMPGVGGFDPSAASSFWDEGVDLAARAVAATEITWSEPARRLVVRGPEEPRLGAFALLVTVRAPVDSRIATRTGAADVEVHGRAGWAAVRTGSGSARLQEVDGNTDVTTGHGGIDLGPVSGQARLRSGAGRVEVAALGGPARVETGSGDIRVGQVSADLSVRTGSGDVVLADAVSGELQLKTGSGSLRVGVHSGVRAELDLSTGSGRAHSELDVTGVAPADGAPLRISGRTGSGDVLVSRSAPVPA